jgi:putative membrane protein
MRKLVSASLVALFAVLVIGFGSLGQFALGGEKLDDKEFVARALSRGIVEEKLAERAVKQAQSQQVRDYAKRLVDDHTKANKELMAIAADMKLGVVAGLDAESKALREHFSRLEPAAFDREFISHMVKAHERDIRTYETTSKSATNAKLRTYATDTLPTLRKHLEEARKIAEKTSK